VCDLETSKRDSLGPIWAVASQEKMIAILRINVTLRRRRLTVITVEKQ